MPYPREYTSIGTAVGWNDDDYLNVISENVAWIESFGVYVPPNGRHRQYERILSSCAKKKLSLGLQRPSPSTSAALTTARYEAHELDRISRQFKLSVPVGLKQKLEEIVSGPVHFYNENPAAGESVQARNTLTELTAGEHFSKHGFEISYGNESYPEPLLEFGNFRFAVQCKRLSSPSRRQAVKNLKKAATQITDNLVADDSCDGGVIYMDISKIVSPLGLIIPNLKEKHISQMASRKKMLDFMYQYIIPFNFKNYGNVCGIILRAAYMFNDENDPYNIDSYGNHVMYREPPGGSDVFAHIRNEGFPIDTVAGGYEAKKATILVAD